MDDIKLLELAAKAAGYQVEWVKNSGCFYRCEEEIGREQWDPLGDDGDALRLACRMAHKYGMSFAIRVAAFLHEEPEQEGDECAATRRAIVRAAAEIGRAM